MLDVLHIPQWWGFSIVRLLIVRAAADPFALPKSYWSKSKCFLEAPNLNHVRAGPSAIQGSNVPGIMSMLFWMRPSMTLWPGTVFFFFFFLVWFSLGGLTTIRVGSGSGWDESSIGREVPHHFNTSFRRCTLAVASGWSSGRSVALGAGVIVMSIPMVPSDPSTARSRGRALLYAGTVLVGSSSTELFVETRPVRSHSVRMAMNSLSRVRSCNHFFECERHWRTWSMWTSMTAPHLQRRSFFKIGRRSFLHSPIRRCSEDRR
mmetsp:Transcript_27693/g.40115  ORF Transcript_27693/g.40115 Transcript_27693/m.40115 type:complete len:262 (+) Transcript_27693:144-929(+)